MLPCLFWVCYDSLRVNAKGMIHANYAHVQGSGGTVEGFDSHADEVAKAGQGAARAQDGKETAVRPG